MAERILQKEFKDLSKEKWLENENILAWNVALIVTNPDSLYFGGYFKAKMTFPDTYPYQPPTFRFNRPLFHPNIYPNGNICISILHTPGDDEMSGELAAERWSPAQRVESVLLSILSLLDDAECSSPANVDAGVILRHDTPKYKSLVAADVEKSKADIPEDFVMPDHLNTTTKVEKKEEPDFWYDSDDEDQFGGSDTDEGLLEEEDDMSPGKESGNEFEDEDEEMSEVPDSEDDEEHDSD
ncbi:hypothetical protein MMC25_007485 [Agyrium rufum]|nr:hypothetical protein [Agyrium rufum]